MRKSKVYGLRSLSQGFVVRITQAAVLGTLVLGISRNELAAVAVVAAELFLSPSLIRRFDDYDVVRPQVREPRSEETVLTGGLLVSGRSRTAGCVTMTVTDGIK